jgi:hypothetical protein
LRAKEEASRRGGSTTTLTSCGSLIELLKDITTSLGNDSLVVLGGLVRAGTSAGQIPFAKIVSMLNILEQVYQVVSTLGLLYDICKEGSVFSEEACELNGAVDNCLIRLSNAPEPVWNEMACPSVQWEFPADDLDKWWGIFQGTLPALKRIVTVEVASGCAKIASGLRAPDFGHFITDTLYSRALAKRHLLPTPVRILCKRNLTILTAMVAHVEDIHKRFGLQPELKNDPDLQLHYEFTKKQHEAVQKAGAVVAAVITVEEAVQPKKGIDAGKLLGSRRAQIPGALIAALEQLASTEQTAPKRQRLTGKSGPKGPAAITNGSVA